MGGLLGRAALPGLLSGPRAPDPRLFVRPSSGGASWTRERTLVAVKPDGVQRRLVGDVIQRFERRGFKLVGMKMLQEHHPCQRLRGGGPEGDPAVVSEQRAGGLGRRRPPERHLPTMSTQAAISHPSSRPGSATSVVPDLSAHRGMPVGPRTPSSLPSAPPQPRGVEQPTLRAF
ncbi:nucleoside diphosphate kinase, mitochondrial isoform X2 [Neovison vison]|uniref:nucleoside diphosphate kinase, mitochondrial isoform X2 n=1 Tax=Neovison vison TaxID=452646 RepID=UPI001CF044DA|nr:nucleoside diphosphate kinase, mitochondrial isoform X2 [Neogale vison]